MSFGCTLCLTLCLSVCLFVQHKTVANSFFSFFVRFCSPFHIICLFHRCLLYLCVWLWLSSTKMSDCFR